MVILACGFSTIFVVHSSYFVRLLQVLHESCLHSSSWAALDLIQSLLSCMGITGADDTCNDMAFFEVFANRDHVALGKETHGFVLLVCNIFSKGELGNGI